MNANFEDAPEQSQSSNSPVPPSNGERYWTQSLRIVGFILLLWALVSLGCGILFREMLDSILPPVGGAPFGFWMAQQGSIIGFLVLLFVYMLLMNRLDRAHGFGNGDKQ